MDKKPAPTSTLEMGRPVLTISTPQGDIITAQTPQVEPDTTFTQTDFLKALKQASRRKRPSENGKGKKKK